MKNSLQINPEKTAKFLLLTISVLLIGQFIYLFTLLVKGYKFHHLTQIFDFNSEGNLPTLYSVLAILFAAMLLLFISFMIRSKDKTQQKYWLVLGIIFIFLAYDEASQMHERLNVVTRALIPESRMDFLYFAWVIPYAILVIFVGLFFLKFLKSLPKRTMVLFIVAGAIFVTGAIGFEMLTSYFRGQNIVHLFITIEELMEMVGIVVFIYSILDYIKNNFGETISIKFCNYSGVNLAISFRALNTF
ncbi:hypothetical protein BH23BAC1_BH23BAC1_15140 [soil metagenome]